MRNFVRPSIFLLATVGLGVLLLSLRTLTSAAPTPVRIGTSDGEKVVKTDAEWRAILTPEVYAVTRQRGTERACSGAHWRNKGDGTYECVCCGQVLFDATAKYESGTGWPSFFRPVREDAVSLYRDHEGFVPRTEIRCSRCDAHLGHVFDDGPPPTGLRFCLNSVALTFVPR